MSGDPRLCRRLLALAVGVGLVGLHWIWVAARSHASGGAEEVVVAHYSQPALALILFGGQTSPQHALHRLAVELAGSYAESP